ncbi:hypothetical protein LguiB_000573 [Lonicera macranthoides]
MDDFSTLARDYGFRPQGKAAPMKSGIGSDGGDRRPRSSSSTTSSPFFNDQQTDGVLFNDVFGGPPKYSSTNNKPNDFDYDSIFKSSATNEMKSKSSSSTGPVYDKPVYDEDIFDGLPGLKSKSMSSSAGYDENVFASMSSPSKSDHFDDLLGNFGQTEKMEAKNNKSQKSFDDLLPGFGSVGPSASDRPSSVSTQPTKTTSSSNQTASNVMEDPFVVLQSTSTPGVSSSGVFTDPLEDLNQFSSSRNKKADGSSVSGGIFDDIDPLNTFGSTSKEPTGTSSKYSESHSQKKVPVDDLQDSHQTKFDMPNVYTDSHKSFGPASSSPSYVNANFKETNTKVETTPRSEEQVQPDDVWLTVEEIPLFTQPTQAPPPSRPPPPIPGHGLKSERGSFAANTRNKGGTRNAAPKSPVVSQVDELEDFARGGTRNTADENADIHYSEEMNTPSGAAASAASMKEAMDRAEAKFRHAKEVRGTEFGKATRNKEVAEKDEEEETREGDFRQNQERVEHERRQWEEEERERRKERERAREIERERARQAVDRANREARERAAAEARRKAERAAVQRAQAEARERAAAEARERAERAAAEARERANAEIREKEAREKAAVARAEADARRRAERAAVERVAAEARERAAAEARERAAAAARMNQQKNDDDLESFFSMNSRPSSAPRPRASSSDPVPDPQFQSRGGPGASRTSSGPSSNMKKASSTTNIVDDLSSIFGTAASSGEFQDIEGETEERRRARLERHQRTQERAAKALAEKNQRDLQTQRDQEEKHRIAETLDIEIKRWAAGKEGNLRALLSTLQYVLWPECGWQPISLTDLIMGASVKKAYRKATLCIHPDKVQQKGANLQQKYVAEKVFDLLKEAWNKFNSEELF